MRFQAIFLLAQMLMGASGAAALAKAFMGGAALQRCNLILDPIAALAAVASLFSWVEQRFSAAF
jgi:hypothetical protein